MKNDDSCVDASLIISLASQYFSFMVGRTIPLFNNLHRCFMALKNTNFFLLVVLPKKKKKKNSEPNQKKKKCRAATAKSALVYFLIHFYTFLFRRQIFLCIFQYRCIEYIRKLQHICGPKYMGSYIWNAISHWS